MVVVHQPGAADARSLSDQAYYQLRELIVTLQLAPGSVIDERELMTRLDLGRTPIREALRTLARERLVDVYPRRGIFVSRVDAHDLAGLSEVRATLEGLAARLAAERATAEQRQATAMLLNDLDQPGHDERSLIDLDQRLHRHIHAAAHNPYLAATLDEYYMLTLRIWLLALDRVASLDQAIGQHRVLLSAIQARDGASAEQAMRDHVRGFERAIRAVL